MKLFSKVDRRIVWICGLVFPVLGFCGDVSFSSEEIAPVTSWREQRSHLDLVLLLDGNLVYGSLEHLPPLKYDFGAITIPADDVLYVTRAGSKWVVKSSNGQNFCAQFQTPSLRIREVDESGKSPGKVREIFFEQIHSLLGGSSKPSSRASGYQLTFVNGDELPVDLIDPTILVTDGKAQREIRVEDIEALTFNGALQGTLRDQQGKESHLPLCFVLQPLLTVKISDVGGSRRFPWSSIEGLDRISKEQRERSFAEVQHRREELFKPQPILSLLRNEVDATEIAFETEPSSEEKSDHSRHNLDLNMVALADPIGLQELELYPAEEVESVGTVEEEKETPVILEEKKPEILPQEEKTFYVGLSPASGFCIDRKKVTNREYQAFVQAIGYRTPHHWKGGNIPVGLEEAPVVNINYRDALLYAIWAGKKIPSWKQLQEASCTPGALLDQADGLNEWTCSLETVDVRLSDKKACFKTFGGEKEGPITYGEAHPQIGFRLVND